MTNNKIIYQPVDHSDKKAEKQPWVKKTVFSICSNSLKHDVRPLHFKFEPLTSDNFDELK